MGGKVKSSFLHNLNKQIRREPLVLLALLLPAVYGLYPIVKDYFISKQNISFTCSEVTMETPGFVISEKPSDYEFRMSMDHIIISVPCEIKNSGASAIGIGKIEEVFYYDKNIYSASSYFTSEKLKDVPDLTYNTEPFRLQPQEQNNMSVFLSIPVSTDYSLETCNEDEELSEIKLGKIEYCFEKKVKKPIKNYLFDEKPFIFTSFNGIGARAITVDGKEIDTKINFNLPYVINEDIRELSSDPDLKEDEIRIKRGENSYSIYKKSELTLIGISILVVISLLIYSIFRMRNSKRNK